jgi:serine/threonine-protein kinase RsbW
MTSPGPQVHLAIASRPENVELVQIAVEASLAQLAIPEDDSHWIGIAVREAVANAIKHGNRDDPTKRVEIDFGLEGNQVVVRVADQGAGFDPGALPDPLSPENLLRPNGRGIFFMRRFMDDIDYTFRPGGGTVVTLRKKVSPTVEPAGACEKEEDQA